MADLKWLINSLTFSDGHAYSFAPGDIVVFVGPNNAGKSQALKDIFNLLGKTNDGVVIKKLVEDKGIVKDEAKDALIERADKWFSSFSQKSHKDGDNNTYHYLNSHINAGWIESFYNSTHYDAIFRNVFVSFLKTEDRLTLVAPPPLLNKTDPRTHPIQIVKDEEKHQKRLSEYFHRAFGIGIFPSIETKNISMILGSLEKVADQGNLDPMQVMAKLKEAQSKMPLLEEQGDGMRSFTGILLNLMMPNYSVFLMDEPESFLHPPQARILGEILPEMIPADRQAFIATHSQDLLKGLIEKSPDRVKIIRITRDKDVNNAKLLDNNHLRELWKDSFMKYSNILDSLFHENVVMCESDSDCKVYSFVLDTIKAEEGRASNTLFSNCGGKDRFRKIAGMLKQLGVDFRIVPDLDFLNNVDLVKEVFKACGGDWDGLKLTPRYNDVASGVKSLDKTFTLGDLKLLFQNFLDSKEANDKLVLENKELEKLKKGIAIPKGWDMVKHSGVSAFPHGQTRTSFKTIDNALKEKGIFMPEVGELENFFPSIGGHGPGWSAEVISQYNGMSDEDKEPVKKFIKSLNL